jgi:hypothetical protein
MSSNVDYLKVKEAQDLHWQFDVLKKFFERDGDGEVAMGSPDPEIENRRWVTCDGICECGKVEGILDDTDPKEWIVRVPEDYEDVIDWSGSASGSRWDIFEALLKESAGYIRFRALWNDGGIVEYIVRDGQITEKEIDW